MNSLLWKHCLTRFAWVILVSSLSVLEVYNESTFRLGVNTFITHLRSKMCSWLPHRLTFFSSFIVVRAKLSRRRLPFGEPEFEVEGWVEFIQQGPLLPYDTKSLLQQWMLINLRCAHTLVRPGRAQLYILSGTVKPEGTIAFKHLFPWHKKDINIAVATRKWKHHKCWKDWK